MDIKKKRILDSREKTVVSVILFPSFLERFVSMTWTIRLVLYMSESSQGSVCVNAHIRALKAPHHFPSTISIGLIGCRIF